MPLHEPLSTALLIAVASALMGFAVISSRASERFGIPVMLAFLFVGMLAGEQGAGIQFSNYQASFRFGTLALVLILFEGGLSTPLGLVRSSWRPATLLASLGVLAVAGLSALAGRVLGFSWQEAGLLGAVVSCTDAAAVFAVLRGQNLRLKRRVALTLELEAGLNDPLAVALTLGLTEALLPGQGFSFAQLAMVPLQFAIGAICGWAVGLGGSHLLHRIKLPSGLHPVLSLSLAGLSFALPTLLQGSGFLGVYVAAVVMGNRHLPHRASLLRVHGALAWIAQVGMFLMLGLLITPSKLLPVALPAAGMALILAFLTRPLAVALCLAPFGYSLRETLYIGWVGLRGAMPIILATIPVMAGLQGAESLFHTVFFIVVVGALLPGSTIHWITDYLGMGARKATSANTSLEINALQPMEGEIRSYLMEPSSPGLGRSLGSLRLPEGAWIVGLVRDKRFLRPRVDEKLRLEDQLYLMIPPGSHPELEEELGEPE